MSSYCAVPYDDFAIGSNATSSMYVRSLAGSSDRQALRSEQSMSSMISGVTGVQGSHEGSCLLAVSSSYITINPSHAETVSVRFKNLFKNHIIHTNTH